MNYTIAIGTLGVCAQDILDGVPGFHWINRFQYGTGHLTHNMNDLYAWNLRGSYGFESDGPCCFIKYGEDNAS